jgi:hypothetical protein
MKLYLLSVFLLSYLTISVGAQSPPPIGIIDFFGLRTVTKQQILDKLPLKVGDPIPSEKTVDEIVKQLKTIPDVADATLDFPCCDEKYGKTILYVGIREKNSPKLIFRKAPNGSIRLPAGIISLDEEFTKALIAAVIKGEASEDDSQGHSLINNAEARAVQLKFTDVARAQLPVLRSVLRRSSSAEHRALAVEVIAYSKDKAAIVGDLVYAMGDPSEKVRNNATRALAVLARYSQKNPGKRLSIPYGPFIDLLNSVSWTDRNKSSMALFSLTESRNPALLSLLEKRTYWALREMARWQSDGHALAPFIVLGRIFGLADRDLFEAMRDGSSKDPVIGIIDHIRRHK